MRIFTAIALVLGTGLLAGCGSGSNSLSGSNVTGRWVRSANVAGSSLIMTLQESGQQVSGTGSYAIEAGRSGTLQVTGSATGIILKLTLTYDSGTTYRFNGQITDANHLNGTLISPDLSVGTVQFVRSSDPP